MLKTYSLPAQLPAAVVTIDGAGAHASTTDCINVIRVYDENEHHLIVQFLRAWPWVRRAACPDAEET